MGLCGSKEDNKDSKPVNSPSSNKVQRTTSRQPNGTSHRKVKEHDDNSNRKHHEHHNKNTDKNGNNDAGHKYHSKKTEQSLIKPESTPNFNEIDREITKNEEVKVLLLGAGESGKSTILRQLKIIHQNGFNQKEKLNYKSYIYDNLIEIGQDLISGIQNFGNNDDPIIKSIFLPIKHNKIDENSIDLIHDNNFDNKNDIDKHSELTELQLRRFQSFAKKHKRKIDIKIFPKEFSATLYKIWHLPITLELMNSPDKNKFYLMDSAPYFIHHISRITKVDYIPSNEDILHVRKQTSGVVDTVVDMGSNLKLHVFDIGGQRSERKQWIHCFNNVTMVIFCVSLSEYDQFLMEDNEQNRFQESLVLFDNIINSRWFSRSSVVLFLNKIDLFAEKLTRSPLNKYFPDYTGGEDINKATKYILWRFMKLNRSNLTIYPHVTQATDTSNIQLVFAAIKETILENSLKASGIL